MPIRLQLLLSNQIPAALLPEPLLTLAQSKGAQVIKDDRQLDICLTVLAMDTTRVAEHPTLPERFLKAYGAAGAKINENPEAFKETLVKKTRFPMPVKDLYKVPVFPETAPPAEKRYHGPPRSGSCKLACSRRRFLMGRWCFKIKGNRLARGKNGTG